MRALGFSQIAALAGVLAVTTFGGYQGYQRLAPKPAVAARVQTAEVARGSINATVSATGSVAAPAQSKLTFKSAGRLAQLQVNVGDQVQEGQPLARIDDSDLQVALVQAQASYNSAAAKLEQTKAGSTAQDIAAAQAQVDAAKVKLAQLQNVPQSPDMAAAQSQLNTAKIKLDQLQNPRPEDITAAQAQVDSATAKLQALTNPRPEDMAAAQSQLNTAKIKLQQLLNPRPEDIRTAEDALASARAKLQGLTSVRPEDLAAAQTQLDTAKSKLAQLQDQPRTAKPEDVANAQLAVQSAQVAYDKALADSGLVGKAGGPATQQASDQAVKTALIGLQTAQNNLAKLQVQGPTDWDIRQAQLGVDQAQAALDKLRNPNPSDVQAAQLAVDQAQVSLDKLKNPSQFDVQAQQEAVNQAQSALDKLQSPGPADVQAAQQALVAAQTALTKLQNPSAYDIQAQQEAVNQAQSNIDKILNNNSYDVQTSRTSLAQAAANLDLKKAGPTQQDLAVSMAAVDQAQASLQQARNNLSGAVLTAPYAGTVAATSGNLGEQVASGTAVVTLVDTRQVRVDVVVDETDVAKVQPGQTTTLTFEALPNQRINGHVTVVAPTATVQQGVVNYQVQIQVDPGQPAAQAIRPGMTATASIVVAQADNAVVVPNRAIKTQGRTRTVEVMDAEGKPQTRQIQAGLANDTLTEVLNGLQPGDVVVIPTTSTAAARVPGLGGAGGFGGPPGGGPVIVRGG